MSEQYIQQNQSDEFVRFELLKTLEYYFSSKNLTKDEYLISQMDSDCYVSIDEISKFNKIKKLTSDIDLIKDIIRQSSQLELDPETNSKVRSINGISGGSYPSKQVSLKSPQQPQQQRSVLILREVSPEATLEKLIELFENKEPLCSPCEKCESAGNDSWYVTFSSEEQAQRALQYLKGEVQTFLDKPIKARIKAHAMPRNTTAVIGSNQSIVLTPSSTPPPQSGLTPVNHSSPQVSNQYMPQTTIHYGPAITFIPAPHFGQTSSPNQGSTTNGNGYLIQTNQSTNSPNFDYQAQIPFVQIPNSSNWQNTRPAINQPNSTQIYFIDNTNSNVTNIKQVEYLNQNSPIPNNQINNNNQNNSVVNQTDDSQSKQDQNHNNSAGHITNNNSPKLMTNSQQQVPSIPVQIINPINQLNYKHGYSYHTIASPSNSVSLSSVQQIPINQQAFQSPSNDGVNSQHQYVVNHQPHPHTNATHINLNTNAHPIHYAASNLANVTSNFTQPHAFYQQVNIGSHQNVIPGQNVYYEMMNQTDQSKDGSAKQINPSAVPVPLQVPIALPLLPQVSIQQSSHQNNQGHQQPTIALFYPGIPTQHATHNIIFNSAHPQIISNSHPSPHQTITVPPGGNQITVSALNSAQFPSSSSSPKLNSNSQITGQHFHHQQRRNINDSSKSSLPNSNQNYQKYNNLNPKSKYNQISSASSSSSNIGFNKNNSSYNPNVNTQPSNYQNNHNQLNNHNQNSTHVNYNSQTQNYDSSSGISTSSALSSTSHTPIHNINSLNTTEHNDQNIEDIKRNKSPLVLNSDLSFPPLSTNSKNVIISINNIPVNNKKEESSEEPIDPAIISYSKSADSIPESPTIIRSNNLNDSNKQDVKKPSSPLTNILTLSNPANNNNNNNNNDANENVLSKPNVDNTQKNNQSNYHHHHHHHHNQHNQHHHHNHHQNFSHHNKFESYRNNQRSNNSRSNYSNKKSNENRYMRNSNSNQNIHPENENRKHVKNYDLSPSKKAELTENKMTLSLNQVDVISNKNSSIPSSSASTPSGQNEEELINSFNNCWNKKLTFAEIVQKTGSSTSSSPVLNKSSNQELNNETNNLENSLNQHEFINQQQTVVVKSAITAE